MAITAELPDGRTVEFPDGTDPSVMQTAVKKLLGVPEQSAFRRGAEEALREQLPSNAGATAEMLAERTPIGKDSLLQVSEYLKTLANEQGGKIEPLKAKRFTEIFNDDSLTPEQKRSEYLTALGELSGSVVGTIAPNLAGGIAGGAVAGPLGAIAGAAVPSAIQNFGGLYNALEEAGVDKEAARQQAELYGAPLAALDLVGVGSILNKTGLSSAAIKTLAGHVAKEAGVQSAVGAGSQALQSYAISDATGKDFNTPENIEDIITMGAVGGLVGAPLGALSHVQSKRAATDPESTLNKQKIKDREAAFKQETEVIPLDIKEEAKPLSTSLEAEKLVDLVPKEEGIGSVPREEPVVVPKTQEPPKFVDSDPIVKDSPQAKELKAALDTEKAEKGFSPTAFDNISDPTQLAVQQPEISTLLNAPQNIEGLTPLAVENMVNGASPGDVQNLSDVLKAVQENKTNPVQLEIPGLENQPKSLLPIVNDGQAFKEAPKYTFTPEEIQKVMGEAPSTTRPEFHETTPIEPEKTTKPLNQIAEEHVVNELNRPIPEKAPLDSTKPFAAQSQFVPEDTSETIKTKLRDFVQNPETKPILDRAFDAVNRALKTLSPEFLLSKNVAFNHIQEGDGAHNVVHSVQSLGFIQAALDPKNLGNTLYAKEAFHFLKNTGFLNEGELKTLTKGSPDIVKYLKKVSGLEDSDLKRFLGGDVAFDELGSQAFAHYLGDKKFSANLGKDVRPIFDKMQKALATTGNTLKGEKIKSLNDLIRPEPGKSFNTEMEIYNHLADISNSRLETIARQAREYQVLDTLKALGDPEKALYGLKDLKNTPITQMGILWAKKNGKAYLAQRIPGFAPIFNVFQNKLQEHAAIAKQFSRDYNRLLNSHSNPAIITAQDSLDHLRMTKQAIKRDANGQVMYYKDGKQLRLSVDASKALTDFQSLFQGVAKLKQHSLLENLQPFGLDPHTVSPKDVLAKIDEFKQAKEATTSAVKKNSLDRKINTLESLNNSLSDITNLVKNDIPYIPHMRFGRHAFLVYDKRTGKLVGNYAIENTLGSDAPNPKQLAAAKKEIQAKYGDGNYDYNLNKPIVLTANKLMEVLGGTKSPFMTTELVASLLGGVDQETYTAVMNELKAKNKVNSVQRHFLPSENIDGYSKDWDRVIPSYLNSMSFHIVNSKYEPAQATLMKAVGKMENQSFQKYVTDYIKEQLNPDSDYTMWRSFNFMYTMGANVSSAFMNVFNVPVQGVSYITQYSPGLLTNQMRMMKAATEAGRLVSDSDAPKKTKSSMFGIPADVVDLGDSKYHRLKILKGQLSPELSNLILKAFNAGEIQNSTIEENIGGSAVLKKDAYGQMSQAAQNFSRSMSFMTSRVEQFSRLSTLIMAHKALEDPKALARGLKMLEHDKLFESMLASGKYTDKEALAIYTVQETHGIQNKANRADVLKGIGGAVLMPFMGWPIRMMEMMGTMAVRNGADGRRGLAYLLASSALLFGVNGLPYAEFVKKLYETYYKVVGVDKDAEQDLNEALISFGIDPKSMLTVSKGFLGSHANMDISNRAAVPAFFQGPMNIATAVMAGEKLQPSQVMGPAGSLVQGIYNTVKDLQTGGNPIDAVMGVSPIAFSNAYAGLVKYNSYGIETQNKTKLLNPDQISFETKFLKTMGFKSMQESLVKQANREYNLSKNPTKVGQDIYTERGVNIYMAYRDAVQVGDKDASEDLRLQYEKNTRDYLEFLQKYNRKPLTSQVIMNLNKTVTEKATQRITALPTRVPKGLDTERYLQLRKEAQEQ